MIEDHELRYVMANELHARPFPRLTAPSRCAYLAIKHPNDAASRDRGLDRAHLVDLLDRFGAAHPQPGATHFTSALGRNVLKWESHTEFVTYSVFSEGMMDRPFDGRAFDVFPEDWLAGAPGQRITSALIPIETMASGEETVAKLNDWFEGESLAASYVVDRAVVIASDFRIDPAGHLRMAVFVDPRTGPSRTGRIVQRLCEIETYKTMSMLGLVMARDLNARLTPIERDLFATVEDLREAVALPEQTLDALLKIAAELENLSTRTGFRFGATGAYEAIVHQRINVLREERFDGRQTFGEFMMRRFDPAMRTVKSAEKRLEQLNQRAIRAGELLRTRVDVERQAQNQRVLESMDRRADLQLRLQETVEGLSVVAISYYALNLALYLFGPLGEEAGLSKTGLAAMLTLPVVLLVWFLIRRIRRSIG